MHSLVLSGAGKPSSPLSQDAPIAIAILAMGGQGGGVLSDWIVALGEAHEWVVQSTSVPGVAQRTGATIYYVEMIKKRAGAQPVLALSPISGDVDVVIAAEWMEGGRAMMRGFVSPDRTTLIASTHRAFAVGEKEQPGDGVADPGVVSEAASFAARRTVAFDMAAVADANGSVVSAALFGALAGSGALPFARAAFEQTIRDGGVGVAGSLRAFAAAYERAQSQDAPERPARVPAKVLPVLPDRLAQPQLDALVQRIRTGLPEPVHGMAYAGIKRLVEWQDAAYAGQYLDRLAALAALDASHGGAARGFAFTLEAARQLAVAMAYDDVHRVAELKIRASRLERVGREMAVKDGEILYTTEFMHPRMEEICGALPAWLGAAIEARPSLFRRLDGVVNKGRKVQTGTIGWFLSLYVVAGLRRYRRASLRHGRELAHIAAWLGLAEQQMASDSALAVEVLKCRRLVKGYSDTHARGSAKFDRVLSVVPRLAGRPDAAVWLARLREVALKDDAGIQLEGALQTLDSILQPTH